MTLCRQDHARILMSMSNNAAATGIASKLIFFFFLNSQRNIYCLWDAFRWPGNKLITLFYLQVEYLSKVGYILLHIVNLPGALPVPLPRVGTLGSYLTYVWSRTSYYYIHLQASS